MTDDVRRQEQPLSGETPPFVQSALRVFDLSLSQMLWSRRTIFMVLVVGGPVIVAFILRALVLFAGDVDAGLLMSGSDLFGLMFWVFYLGIAVPLMGLFYGTALIADEVEDKTLTYLFTRPISRGAVLVGKYLAYLVCTGFVVLPSLMVVFFLVMPLLGGSIGSGFPDLLKDLGLLAVGLAVYGAVFALAGAAVKRPLLAGLVFIFGWEPGVLMVPGYMKQFTVRYYMQGLAPHSMPADDSVLGSVLAFLQSAEVIPSTLMSLTGLVVILVGGLGLAIWLVERREYVLEQ
jgi:ABC-2 type transport system permease protein